MEFPINLPITSTTDLLPAKPFPEKIKRLIWDEDPQQRVRSFMDGVKLQAALEMMVEEVEELCGEPHKQDDIQEGRYIRWGYNPGSIAMDSGRVKVRVPRVQDTQTGKARPLESYRALHRPSEQEQARLTHSVFQGMAQREYAKLEKEYPGGFGWSSSSVSRRFQECTARVLKQFESRDLSQDLYVVLAFDGTHSRGRQAIICTGITAEGKRRILGFVEAASENAEAVGGLVENLVDRGLRYEQGILCVIDGSKGIHKAVREGFGPYVQIQRCTWHKRENVVSKLSREEDRDEVRKELDRAYNQDSYLDAKQNLVDLTNHLDCEGQHKAANSLREGMEETLTLHRLGAGKELRESVRTTNMMEHINSCLKKRVRKVARWVNSNQFHRWVVMSLVDTEPRLKKFEYPDQLAHLQKALLEQVQKRKTITSSSWPE